MSLLDQLDPLFSGIDGISTAVGALIWIILAALAIGSTVLYLPLKRRFAERTEPENAWPEVLGQFVKVIVG